MKEFYDNVFSKTPLVQRFYCALFTLPGFCLFSLRRVTLLLLQQNNAIVVVVVVVDVVAKVNLLREHKKS